jgi:hypothetical protein
MKRSLLAVALMVVSATTVRAQHPQLPQHMQGISADSVAKLMNGTWEGPFTADQFPGGTMSVAISHDSTGVKATMTISAHMDVPPSTLENIRHDAGKITWTQQTGDMSCSGSATHNADGALVGSLDCGHAILSFTLTKAAAPKTTKTQ